MLLFSWNILTFVLLATDADLWSPSTAAFVPHPMPTSSKWQYAQYLASCYKLFHSLFDNCDNDCTVRPFFTDRTPAKHVSDADTAFKKHLAFYDYNIDQEIYDAKGVKSGNMSLHTSDFTRNPPWQCKRINYRHLVYYEMATTGQLEKHWNPSGSWSRYYLVPKLECLKHIHGTAFYHALKVPSAWTPAKVNKVINNDMTEYYEGQSSAGVNFDDVPSSKFYLQYDFARIVQMAINAQTLFSGTTFVDELNDSWTNKIMPDANLSESFKASIGQFKSAIKKKWNTTDPNTNFYNFSEMYFKMSSLLHHEELLGLISLKSGQLGDFFYLNYFFGLPS